MLLTAVIIVLREVLEAALLISILSALSYVYGIERKWIGWSLLGGVAGAAVLAYHVDAISDLFDGVGQEITNATIQLCVYILLGVFVYLLLRTREITRHREQKLKIIMAGMVVLAIMREGFEILVYVSGFSVELRQLLTVLVGATVGASIGISIGALVYYLLISLRYSWSRAGAMVLLFLVAAGMTSQAAQLLIQADWLPSDLPIWDSSSVIAEESLAGQLLYAIMGYEATPTAIEAGCHIGSGLLLLLVAIASLKWRKQRGEGEYAE